MSAAIWERPVSDTGTVEIRRSRRAAGGFTTLVAIVLVLVAIAVVGDRVAAKYAGEQLRTQLVAELDNRGVQYDTTEITIGGFPFLDQVAQGRYDSIAIDMTNVRLATNGGGTAQL